MIWQLSRFLQCRLQLYADGILAISSMPTQDCNLNAAERQESAGRFGSTMPSQQFPKAHLFNLFRVAPEQGVGNLFYSTSRVKSVPLSRCRFPLLELNTDTELEASRDSPFIPAIADLAEARWPAELLGPPLLMEGGAGMLSG